MPPVFGPSSPSNARLKSCAAGSGIAFRPSHSARTDTSVPSSNSSTTKLGPSEATAGSAASSSSCVRQTKTPLPAASPSALITHGGCATASASAVGNAGCAHHVLGERLRALDSRRRGARAEDGDAVVTQGVGHAGDERRLRPDDDEIEVERAREVEQAVGVLRAHRMARAVARDAGIAGGAVQLGEARALRQLPGERVLASAGPHDEHLHGTTLLGFEDVRARAGSGGMQEPGLDLHEWETRWAELEEAAHESPEEAAAEMDRLLEQMLRERGYEVHPAPGVEEEPEIVARFRAARELAHATDSGDAAPGDVAAAIENYRELFEHLVTEYPAA